MWRLDIRRFGCGLAAARARRRRGAGGGLRVEGAVRPRAGQRVCRSHRRSRRCQLHVLQPGRAGLGRRVEVEAMPTLVAPRSELKDAEGSTVLGTPIGGRDTKDDIGEDARPAGLLCRGAAAGGVRVGPRRSTRPSASPPTIRTIGSAATTASARRLTTVNINPALAWRATDWLVARWRLPGPVRRRRRSPTRSTSAPSAPLRGIPGAVPGGQDGFARLHGDDWAYGWNAGRHRRAGQRHPRRRRLPLGDRPHAATATSISPATMPASPT